MSLPPRPLTPETAQNYAAQEITDLFFSWANFYKNHIADLKKYDLPVIAETPQLKEFMATGPNSIQEQDGVQTFKIQYSPTGPYDLKNALEFSTLVWEAMWMFSKDTTPIIPGGAPTVSLTPRFLTSKATVTKNCQGLPVLSDLSPKVLAMIKKNNNGLGTSSPSSPRAYPNERTSMLFRVPTTTKLY